MRWIHFFLAVTVAAVAIALAYVFLVFEKEKHERFYYASEDKRGAAGDFVVDRYKTEERVIYREVASYPRNIYATRVDTKIVFKKKGHVFEKLLSEKRNGGTLAEATYIEASPGAFSFLSSYNSRFSSARDIPCPRNVTPFSPRLPVTYFPLVDNYDFALGGSQPFDVLFLGPGLMPPARGKVILTSIKDEFLTYAGRSVKSECLVVKTKISPEARIWVSKKSGKILLLSIKSDYGFTARMVRAPKKTKKSLPGLKSALYAPEEVMIPSQDVGIAGTLTVPRGAPGENAYPAVLFVGGEPAVTRDNAGLFLFLSDALSKRGFVTLRFDRRGTGKSQGDNMFASLEDETRDIENALKFLRSNKNVDQKNVFIIAHSESALLIPRADLAAHPVRGVVMLSPRLPVKVADPKSEIVSAYIARMMRADPLYEETLKTLEKYTDTLLRNASRDGIFVFRKPVFVKRMGEIDRQNFFSSLGRINAPVLIIYGKSDSLASAEGVKKLENALLEAGLKNTSTVYFRTLGHFLGHLSESEDTVKYYAPDGEVTQTVIKWLGEKSAPEAETAETEEKEGAGVVQEDNA